MIIKKYYSLQVNNDSALFHKTSFLGIYYNFKPVEWFKMTTHFPLIKKICFTKEKIRIGLFKKRNTSI